MDVYRGVAEEHAAFKPCAAYPSLAVGTSMKIKDTVRIIELRVVGRIVAIYEDSTGQQFNVRYFWNGEAKTVYFYADEIRKVDERESAPAPTPAKKV